MKKMFSSGEGVDFVQVGLALVLVFVVGLIVVSVYWLTFDDNPAVDIYRASLYQDGDIETHELTVAAGSEFYYGLDYCKYTNAPATIRTTWIDELVYTEPENEQRRPAAFSQGCGHMHILKTIPKTLLPAEYDMRVTLEYQVNPIARRYVTYDVGKIIVVEGE
jgi:hypothetical protein